MGKKIWTALVTVGTTGWRLWRAYWWTKAAVFGLLMAEGILGFGPKAPTMSNPWGFEVWIITHTAHPVFLALVVGLMFATWLVPDFWRWFKKHGETAKRDETVDLLSRIAESVNPNNLANSPIAKALEAERVAQATQFLRNSWINALVKEYVMSHDGVPPAIIAGTQLPPAEWMNRRLAELGKPWRV